MMATKRKTTKRKATKRKATKRKATGMEWFNVLLSRKYLKLEKPIMKIQEIRGRWFREAEFQEEKLVIKVNLGLG